jgi:hypothetical protein
VRLRRYFNLRRIQTRIAMRSGTPMLIIFRVVYLNIWIFYVDWSTVLVALIYINYILCIFDHFLNMPVNYGITVLSTWVFHFASLLNVTPKCLWEVVMGTDFPLKEKSRFSGMLRLEKIMISILSGLNYIDWSTVLVALIYINYILCIFDHFLNMPVNYGITVGLGIHKNWNNFNWKLPRLLQAYLFSQFCQD